MNGSPFILERLESDEGDQPFALADWRIKYNFAQKS